jgi:hypothetical protein
MINSLNKIFIIFIFFIFPLASLAIKPYEASYTLNVTSDIGSLKVGYADFKLELTSNNEFTFASQAYTDSIWKKLYNYNRYEKSIGNFRDGNIKGVSYDLVEIEKDEVKKNNKILVNYDGGYASFNNETRWKLQSESILDELNVYLALSEDLMKNSNQNELSYNVIDEKGIQLISFVYDGTEMITIENEKLNSIKFLCPELKIHINVSKEYNYIPLIINRNSSGNKFKLILTKYIPS